jgi:hypothetical protein
MSARVGESCPRVEASAGGTGTSRAGIVGTGPRAGNGRSRARRGHVQLEVRMAERRRGGDQRATRRDGSGGAGAGPMQATGPGEQRASGQQSGSKRPAVKTGAAKRAPKKGDKG